MKVLLLGASGNVGRPVLRELLARGHAVTALVRDPSVLTEEFPELDTVTGDVFDDGLVASFLDDREVLISSVALRVAPQRARSPLELTRVLAAAAAATGVRWVSVGGAGSLRTASGADFVDSPDFPAVAAPESRGFRDALHELKDHAPAGLVWTVVSPPAIIDPAGERTGRYRTSADELIVAADGRSSISSADLAVAIVDEAESGAHPAQRFAVGY